MKSILSEVFKKSLETGFIDKQISSEAIYQPELLVNSSSSPLKVLSTIIHEFNNCSEFYISVAFVTTSGIASLIECFKELEKKNIQGKILVSQYLNFTQPEALKKLSQFKNITLKIATRENFHAKGYIFKKATYYNLIIGSSNLTATALSTNKEWNLKVAALQESGLVEKVLNEFKANFNKARVVDDAFITEYEEIYKKQLLLHPQDVVASVGIEITPNAMQQEALHNLQRLREEHKTKALLISTTGTGKTYLSAFDAQCCDAQKHLFVVHRLTIAQKSMSDFKDIFGHKKSMGLYSGKRQELDNDYIFSTVQTISKPKNLAQFSKDHFDYIIIDESHRSGSDSYRRLIEYFNPKFLLGMTATPERTDGDDIFSLFDHNIAYEIRLQRAMQEDMLSQFHYYGVTDISINDTVLEQLSDFKRLTADVRIDGIINHASFYGTDNGITRGLAFCSRNNEAAEFSLKFNTRGYRTLALSGANTEEERVDAIKRLESDDIDEKLDYIFTVDIFNEGGDIPKVNQILMIRPAESAIIFIQQLGRGLRKVASKSYLTIIDFIGNYNTNYLIPIALYGDTSYNKDSLRRLISAGSNLIPGASTINFDTITKERIFQSINVANMQLLADLKKDYNLLKYKIGRIPCMMDFVEQGSRDPFLYVIYAKSYYNFIGKVEKNFTLEMSDKSMRLLEIFSQEINNAIRVEESLILKNLITYGHFSSDELKDFIAEKYGYEVSDETVQSCISNINLAFIRKNKGGKLLPLHEIFTLSIMTHEKGHFAVTDDFNILLQQAQFKYFLLDTVAYAIDMFDKNFILDIWHKGFVLYRKYSRKDAFRILNVAVNPVPQNVGGYLVSPDKKHCPLFVNYHKEDDISESTKYEDKFISNTEFDWMTKSRRSIESDDVRAILGKDGEIRLPLFIKKNNDEGKDFYYMGEVTPNVHKVEQTSIRTDKGESVSIVKISFNLSHPVSDTMYHYLREHEHTVQRESLHVNTAIPSLKGTEMLSIPFYNFYAAAGSFSEMQTNNDFTLIDIPLKYKSTDEYFACTIRGESMNRVIPNCSVCLFKKYVGGSRNGKIVLVENFDFQDQDFNSAFTVKTYISKKTVRNDSWEHTAIILKPNSHDKTYTDIILHKEDAAEMKIIGEFVKVLH